ncbi:MAG: hypothetical protein ACJA13_001972 [Paraglaciecola sp.]|jgi:hypothetical protein
MKFRLLKVAITGIAMFIGCFVNLANAGLIEVTVNDATVPYTVADGIELFPLWDAEGELNGGKVYSPSGAPDLFFQEGDTPTFPGALDTHIVWALIDSPTEVEEWEGSQDGRGNWMKTVRDSDGRVSWTEFEFNLPPFGTALVGNGLVMVHRYIYDTSGQDFTLAEAINFRAAAVPEPSTLAIFALAVFGLGSRRFKK